MSKRFGPFWIYCPFKNGNCKKSLECLFLREGREMEKDKKIVVVARTEGVEIVVEGENDDYELMLSKPQAMELAMNILNTLYKMGIKM
jgi:hypothetical protein